MGQVPNTNSTKPLEVHGVKKRGQQPRNQSEAGVDTNAGKPYEGKGF